MGQQANKKKSKVAYFFFGNRPVYFNIILYIGLILLIGKVGNIAAMGAGGGAIIAGWLLGKSFSWLLIKVISLFLSKEKRLSFTVFVEKNWYIVFTIFLAWLFTYFLFN